MAPRHKKINQKEIKQQTRLRLLEAAADEFARKGYDKANINHIAEAAGYSIGTVYNYFSSKQDLMLKFIDETTQDHVDYMIDQVTVEEDPSRQIYAFFEAGFSYVEMNTLPMIAILNALNDPNEDHKERLSKGYQPLFQLLSEQVLPLGIDSGDFREVDTLKTARLIMQIYLGTSSQLSPEGKPLIDYPFIADFVLRSLENVSRTT